MHEFEPLQWTESMLETNDAFAHEKAPLHSVRLFVMGVLTFDRLLYPFAYNSSAD